MPPIVDSHAIAPKQQKPLLEGKVSEPQIQSSPIEFNRAAELRELAATGRLAATAATAVPARRHALSGAAFAIAWPVVFARLTRGLEERRGHRACASSVFRMAQDCLDSFYDDVEAVVEDTLVKSTMPIRDLEAWIASRLNAATVDGHRRRRGQRGALQRPRVPIWLADSLNHHPWLTELAVQILLWVGVKATAGSELWPLDAWTLRRGAVLAEPAPSEPAHVAREVETVLAAMRTRPRWYADYVERPLGRKHAPVCTEPADYAMLALVDPADAEDARLAGLAGTALAAIASRLDATEDPAVAVTDVIRSVFAHTTAADLDRAPLAAPDYEQAVAAALNDPGEVDRIVAAVLVILGRAPEGACPSDVVARLSRT